MVAEGVKTTKSVLGLAGRTGVDMPIATHVDLVLEGILQISIDGRVIEGRAGDVLYIPKGSRIVFATPHRVRVFYVTYPADWTAAAAAPARPQK